MAVVEHVPVVDVVVAAAVGAFAVDSENVAGSVVVVVVAIRDLVVVVVVELVAGSVAGGCCWAVVDCWRRMGIGAPKYATFGKIHPADLGLNREIVYFSRKPESTLSEFRCCRAHSEMLTLQHQLGFATISHAKMVENKLEPFLIFRMQFLSFYEICVHFFRIQ